MKPHLSAQYHNSSRCCLWRNASCGICIVNQQEISTGRTVKALSVYGRNVCGTADIKLKRIVGSNKISVKEIQSNSFVTSQRSNEFCLILWRKNKRYRTGGIVESSNQYAGTQACAVYNKGVSRNYKIYRTI